MSKLFLFFANVCVAILILIAFKTMLLMNLNIIKESIMNRESSQQILITFECPLECSKGTNRLEATGGILLWAEKT